MPPVLACQTLRAGRRVSNAGKCQPVETRLRRWLTGLHEGLGSLVGAGVPPRFLIIDDGWQCTDVDRRFRQPPTTRTVPRLSEIGEASDEFFDAELEVLSSAARNIPPSSSAGALLAVPRSAACRVRGSVTWWRVSSRSSVHGNVLKQACLCAVKQACLCAVQTVCIRSVSCMSFPTGSDSAKCQLRQCLHCGSVVLKQLGRRSMSDVACQTSQLEYSVWLSAVPQGPRSRV